jgi:2-methylcitrate dehydratase PrpD
VRRPDVQALMRRVGVETNQNYDPESPGAAVFDQVRVRLADGAVLESEPVAHARGHARRPLTEGELRDKFRGCLDAGGARTGTGPLFDRLQHLQEIGSARELVGAA